MRDETRKINRSLMVGWTVIVVILSAAYIVEVVKGQREWGYVAVFMAVTLIPYLLCLAFYHRKPGWEKLRFRMVWGYLLMYMFCLLTGSTSMVCCYILPLLSLLILYHQPELIMWSGVLSVLLNIVSIILRFLNGDLTLESSKDAEIQIALIILCFSFCYVAAKMYNQIHIKNKEVMAELEEKNVQASQMTMQTVMTIVNTIDAKDEYTKGHSQRVSEYAAALAEAIGMSESEVERIRYIGLLHDIGKIGVPDAILNKPGRLNTTEFSLMKLHTVVGGDILKDINSMENLDEGAKYHHERYDGNGYPEGLEGENIPLVARIIGIADAYDAMTSHRVYRKRLSDEAVEQEIRRGAGTQFDPKLAEAFLQLLKKGTLQAIESDKFDAQDGTDDSVAEELLIKLLDDAGAYNSAETSRDSMTGVHNRMYGEQMLEDYIKSGEGCLMTIDIDALRNINSVQGFLKGDLYINTIANLLERSFLNKILYRSSGDEFVCFLCGVTKTEYALKNAQRLLEAVEQMRAEDEELAELSVSIGFLIVRAGEFSVNEALSRAERAVYFAKQKGGGHISNYHDLAPNFQPALSKEDLNNLLKRIHKQSSYSKAYDVNYPEFARMLNYLERVAERTDQQMQVIMFTLLAADEESVTIDQKQEAMRQLEAAVLTSLRKVDVTVQFSSSQRIVILMNMSRDNLQSVTNRISSAFYKSDRNKLFSLNFEIADMAPVEE